MSHVLPISLSLSAKEHFEPEMNNLFRKSVIFCYGRAFDESKNALPLVQYIREQCAASMRLMQIALTAHESLTAGKPIETFNIAQAWLFITAAFSCVDALIAATIAVATDRIPTENHIPSMQRRGKGLPSVISAQLDILNNQTWYAHLAKTRNNIVHRGHRLSLGSIGFCLIKDSGIFEVWNRSLPTETPLDLNLIARGLLLDLEAWDIALDASIRSCEAFPRQCSIARHRFCIMPVMSPMGGNEGLGFTYFKNPIPPT